MTIRSLFPLLFMFSVAVLPTAVVAQDEGDDDEDEGLTCGWCIQESTFWVLPGTIIILEPPEHKFPRGGDECGWEGHDDSGVMCSRCGGETSKCHKDWWAGRCHIPCGSEGDDVESSAALTDIEEALESGDVTAVASVLREPRTGFSFEFIPEAGRIALFLACDPDRAARTIPVSPEARDRLTAAFGASAWTG